jgi:tetratricopeptide (TPR) repeat protein
MLKNQFIRKILIIIGCFIPFTVAYANEFTKAEAYFAKKEYALAVKAYDSVINSGKVSEKALYELAWAAEMSQQPAVAIYALRKIIQFYGNTPTIKSRLEWLYRKIGSRPVADNRLFWASIRWLLWGIVVIFSLAALIMSVYHRRFRNVRLWKNSISYLSLTGILLAIGIEMLTATPLAIVITNAPIATSPTYAAVEPDILPAASVLTIKEKKDIWFRAELEGRIIWIPVHTVRML